MRIEKLQLHPEERLMETVLLVDNSLFVTLYLKIILTGYKVLSSFFFFFQYPIVFGIKHAIKKIKPVVIETE